MALEDFTQPGYGLLSSYGGAADTCLTGLLQSLRRLESASHRRDRARSLSGPRRALALALDGSMTDGPLSLDPWLPVPIWRRPNEGFPRPA